MQKKKTSSYLYQLEKDPVGVVQDLEIVLNHNMVDEEATMGKLSSFDEKMRRFIQTNQKKVAW